MINSRPIKADAAFGNAPEIGTLHEQLTVVQRHLDQVGEERACTLDALVATNEGLLTVNEELCAINASLRDRVADLDRTQSDLRNLLECAQLATMVLSPDLVVRHFTPAMRQVFPLIPGDQGRKLTDIVNELAYQSLREDVAQVLSTQQQLERRVSRTDQTRHYLMRMLPYRTLDTSLVGVLVSFLDVSALAQAEQHHRLLIDELNHRVKNMLTVVISMASQTLRRAASLEQFASAFLGRVHALTASYSLLSDENWVDVPLRDILTEETKPFLTRDRHNVLFQGPDIRLGPSGALAIGMAIHELTTNAVRHGALSRPEGRVTIEWEVQDEDGTPQFVLLWQEQDGPPVTTPEKRGFGMTLIERGLAYELSGGAVVDFASGGVRARLHAPMQTLLAGQGLTAGAGLARQ